MSFSVYNGVDLTDFEADVLEELEKRLGEPIPVVQRCDGGNFGFRSLNYFIDALAVNYKDLEILPSSMKNLHVLTQLYLNNNQLVDVSECFDGLFLMKHIEIACNRLAALPANIKDMHDLEHLDVQYNHLTELPLEIGALPLLAYLNVGHNNLESLPFTICDLPSLETLVLTGNLIEKDDGIVSKLKARGCQVLMDSGKKERNQDDDTREFFRSLWD